MYRLMLDVHGNKCPNESTSFKFVSKFVGPKSIFTKINMIDTQKITKPVQTVNLFQGGCFV